MASELCQYCGVNLDELPPWLEVGFTYSVTCSRCPPERRRFLVLPRPERVASLDCPDCGARLEPAEHHPDVLVIKELTYEVCPGCGERCGVASVRKFRDLGEGLGDSVG